MATAHIIPNGYTRSSTSYVTVTDPNNMYNPVSDTSNYATLRGRNRNSTTAYYCFINDFQFDALPDEAEVSAFSVKIRCYRSSNQQTGANFRLRLSYASSSGSVISNTTVSSDIGTTASTITIPTGSLTWDDIVGYGSQFAIEVPLASNSSSYPYVYVYGAEIEVTYTIPVHYDVTASSSVSGVAVEPSTQSISEGHDATVTIVSDGSSFTVTDNNVDVTNQLVQVPATGEESGVPNAYENLSSGVTINSSYPITRAYTSADNTANYARLDFSTSTTGYIELLFGIEDIPSSATITSISARARLRVSSTSRMSNTICRLYSGSTAKGSNTTFATTTATLYNLTPGTWTASELSNLKLRIGATSSTSTQSKYIYIYGADVTIDYELSGQAYTYTITNVVADHTVLITSGGSVKKLYAKGTSTSWSQYSKVWLKVNSTTWVEQDSSTWSSLFDDSKKYRKMT